MKKYLPILFILILAMMLRFWNITKVPALNADEAALGYNAYSLIQTGKDEFGTSWPLVFRSFDDYKPGIYVYLDIPFIALLGLNILAVRLPGLILSILAIVLLYKFVHIILEKHPYKEQIALVSALMLAISPWHIHFSRGAWETQVATTFLLGAIIAFYNGITRSRLRLVSVCLFALALYTYHAMRIVVPLLGVGLLILNWRSYFQKHTRITFLSGVVFMFLLIPFYLQMVSPVGIARAQGVGLTADRGPYWRANELRAAHTNMTAPLVRIIHNQWIQYGLAFLSNYMSHFNLDFLFINGDNIQRNKVPLFGQLLLVSSPFLIWGLLRSLRNLKTYAPLYLWLIIAPIPAAMTFQSPHAVRAFSMVIPLSVITAIGIVEIIQLIKFSTLKYVASIAIFVFFTWDTSRYFFNYHKLMIYWYPYSSQYGIEELVEYVSSVQDTYDHIYITDRYDQPYILFLFYQHYSPEKFQAQAKVVPASHGFGTVRNIDNISFESPDWKTIQILPGKKLIVSAPEETPKDTPVFKSITLPGFEDKIIFNISEH